MIEEMPKSLQNLRAEADLAPLAFPPQRFLVALALLRTPGSRLMADANGPFAQIDDNAALALGH